MENKNLSQNIDSSSEKTKVKSDSLDISESSSVPETGLKIIDKPKPTLDVKSKESSIPKKNAKPPKLEDKPFEEFISNHFIPGLKESIEQKGTLVRDIKLIEGKRPVVGGNCWMVYCEISDQKKFWLCFNKDIITSDKTILLAESNSAPSIVESFLIDEKKTTLPLLISRVLQRLNGQKWLGYN